MKQKIQKKENLQTRPPVVVVLGHVDHGKTTILDFIRKTKVAERETGGITQHVGAYEIECSASSAKQDEQAKKISFLDTPGHEAFFAIRSRGAKVADIAILVVAADEGVKPQTKEAISHIKKTGISAIVAINKIDKQSADSEKVKRELFQNDMKVESMGGEFSSVEVSAKTGKGIDTLLELILLVAEMKELKGDISKPGEGVVIEAYLDKQRGPTATLLVRDGVFKEGDIAATDSAFGKIKILENFQGDSIKKAFPSTPIIALGFKDVPQVGEKFETYSDIKSAQTHVKEKRMRATSSPEVFSVEEGKKVLNLILKADVVGSLEAIEEMFKSLPQEKVVLRILKSEVGEVNENDVKLAKSSPAKILSFRVKTSPAARSLAEREKIRIMFYEVIYELIHGARQVMEKELRPKQVRINLGKVRVLVIFRTEKNRQIVGGRITEGEVRKGTMIEVTRREEVVGKGRIISLQRDKKETGKLIKGDECGMLYEGDVRIEEGDILVIYHREKEEEKL